MQISMLPGRALDGAASLHLAVVATLLREAWGAQAELGVFDDLPQLAGRRHPELTIHPSFSSQVRSTGHFLYESLSPPVNRLRARLGLSLDRFLEVPPLLDLSEKEALAPYADSQVWIDLEPPAQGYTASLERRVVAQAGGEWIVWWPMERSLTKLAGIGPGRLRPRRLVLWHPDDRRIALERGHKPERILLSPGWSLAAASLAGAGEALEQARPAGPPPARNGKPLTKHLKVGICLHELDNHAALAEACRELITWLQPGYRGQIIFLSPCQGDDAITERDDLSAHQIADALPIASRGKIIIDDNFHSAASLLALLRNLDLALTSRPSVAQAALAVGTPCLLVHSKRRAAELHSAVGCPSSWAVERDEVLRSGLVAPFARMMGSLHPEIFTPMRQIRDQALAQVSRLRLA